MVLCTLMYDQLALAEASDASILPEHPSGCYTLFVVAVLMYMTRTSEYLARNAYTRCRCSLLVAPQRRCSSDRIWVELRLYNLEQFVFRPNRSELPWEPLIKNTELNIILTRVNLCGSADKNWPWVLSEFSVHYKKTLISFRTRYVQANGIILP